MAEYDLMAAHKHSSRHRDEIAMSSLCGCFSCLDTYAPSEIVEWTDGGTSAICPHCGIDSVIGDASGLPVTSPEFLGAMSDRWFGTTVGLGDVNG
jgi:hypothetical protein